MPSSDARSLLAKVTSELPGGGEARPRQAEMAEAVEVAIRTKQHLVVQAGTGTGKSLAYLVPAVLSGKTVVVATATKALQDQLAGKDLPFLAEHLGRELSFAVLKGRSNYVCLQRIAEISGEGQMALDGLADRASPMELTALKTWAAELTDTGDRAELPEEPSPSAWAAVSVSSQECPGAKRCKKGDDCFAERARRRAADADVVVVNTHLYGLDLASEGMILPEHDLVVLDEAHQLEDTISETAGVEISAGR
ncbi:MAG TPA: DEAD/DEAH box helicase, partial [Acidimicrobiales bacterium]